MILLFGLVLVGCTEGELQKLCFEMCGGVCLPLVFIGGPYFWAACWSECDMEYCGGFYHYCLENPYDPNCATFYDSQIAATQLCEEYPEECQEAFESYVESFEEEAIQ